MGSRILACGHYLPQQVVTNDQLAQSVDTSDAWIRQRTGIQQRHVASPSEGTATMAAAAARQALEVAGLPPSSVDLVICATSTPDETFPSVATRLLQHLDIPQASAMDIQAVCSGFVYALTVADNFLKLGHHQRALVVGAETMSRIVDWGDRSTCVLFGDGAGAVLLEAHEGEDTGILATKLCADGRYHDILYVDGGVASTQTAGVIRMSGGEVFRHAVEKMGQVLEEVCALAGVEPSHLDWIVPHQANARIMTLIASKLDIPYDRVIQTVDAQANTSAATIPLALYTAIEDGRIQRGNLVGLTALGAGITWGGAILRY